MYSEEDLTKVQKWKNPIQNEEFMHNIRKHLKTDSTEKLNNELYKNTERVREINFYQGIVVDNNDPEKLGRCKIRVFGVFSDEIQDKDLPWAVPDFGFIGSTLGSFIVPPNDCIVNVYFDNNDIYKPKYTTKVLNRNDLPTDKDDDYPNTMIFFETDEGEYFKINRQQNLTFYKTASGVTISIDDGGNIDIDTSTSDTGNVTINAGGEIKLGKSDADEPMVLGNQLQEYLYSLHTALQNWVPTPSDGGLALKAQLATFLGKLSSVFPQSTAGILSKKNFVDENNN